MRYEYRHPALVKVPLGVNGRTRHWMVGLDGSAEIPEYGYDDMPIAAVTDTVRGEGVEYRFMDGKFYMRSISNRIDVMSERDVGLDLHMISGISDALRATEGREPQVNPRLAAQAVSFSWLDRMQFRTVPGRFSDLAVRSGDWVDISSLKNFDEAELAYWSTKAHDYVTGLASLDGEIWVPVAEPVLAIGMSPASQPYAVVDASLYEARAYGFRDMPPPYGRRDGLGSEFYHSGYAFASLAEAHRYREIIADAMEGRGHGNLPVFDIRMPEAFAADHAEREMDRVARVVVCEIWSVVKDAYDRMDKAPADVQRLVAALRSQTQTYRGLDAGDALEPLLEVARRIVSTEEGNEPSLKVGFWNSDTLTLLIDHSLAVWRDRPVAVEFSNDTGFAPRP